MTALILTLAQMSLFFATITWTNKIAFRMNQLGHHDGKALRIYQNPIDAPSSETNENRSWALPPRLDYSAPGNSPKRLPNSICWTAREAGIQDLELEGKTCN